MQVLDEDELQLPRVELARFVDMESGASIPVEPDEIRSHYRKIMADRIDDLKRACSHRGIQHSLITTDNPYIEAIEAYMGFRRGA